MNQRCGSCNAFRPDQNDPRHKGDCLEGPAEVVKQAMDWCRRWQPRPGYDQNGKWIDTRPIAGRSE